MYLVGAFHSHKADAQHLLERAATARERLVTDAEVFHEILHRYVAIDRRDAIQAAFDVLKEIIDEVFSIDAEIVERTKTLPWPWRTSSARRDSRGGEP